MGLHDEGKRSGIARTFVLGVLLALFAFAVGLAGLWDVDLQIC